MAVRSKATKEELDLSCVFVGVFGVIAIWWFTRIEAKSLCDPWSLLQHIFNNTKQLNLTSRNLDLRNNKLFGSLLLGTKFNCFF